MIHNVYLNIVNNAQNFQNIVEKLHHYLKKNSIQYTIDAYIFKVGIKNNINYVYNKRRKT